MIGRMACISFTASIFLVRGAFDLAPIKLACEVHRAEIAWHHQHQMSCPWSKRFSMHHTAYYKDLVDSHVLGLELYML